MGSFWLLFQPNLRPMLPGTTDVDTTDVEATMVDTGADTGDTTVESVLLIPSQRLTLTPLSSTPDTPMADTHTPLDTTTCTSVKPTLRPSQRLMLRPTPLTSTPATHTIPDTLMPVTHTPPDTTTCTSVKLRLSPLTVTVTDADTTADTVVDTTAVDTDTVVTAITDKQITPTLKNRTRHQFMSSVHKIFVQATMALRTAKRVHA